MIRQHVAWSQELAGLIDAHPEFELTTQPLLSLFTFRYVPRHASELDTLNQRLLQRINDDGRIYLTQTQHEGRFVIRFVVGQTSTAREDVLTAWTIIQELASGLDR
jgi:aromatic-L-amino-acid decarboxylase